MIGSFWNLCRACPSMPIDKQLHSEYRSTYTWHEYTGPHQEHTVVRRAPQPPPTSTKQASAKLQSAKSTEDENNEGPTLEPPLPRRKKCPELAYKTHEFMTAADGGGIDAVDSNVVADKVREVTAHSGLPPSQLSKAISRISTEYRLQFAWPRRSQLTNGEAVPDVAAAGLPAGTTGPPRKSLSMGALKQGIAPTGPAPVHKKRPGDIDHKRDGMQASELEPLVGGTGTDTIDGVVPEGDEREEEIPDVRMSFRGKKSGRTVRILDDKGLSKPQKKPFPTTEVIELRRLADEYKHRDWGCGLAAEDEASLWKQVSSNHALNALSLARSVTKEEKEKENTRKVAPSTTVTMPPAGRPSSVQARPMHGILQDDSKTDTERAIARARKDFLIRHHLDRTTGVGDGALLPSPTREKLEPVIPRRREDTKEHREEIQPKTKSSPKNSPRTGRSQSLGPTVTERRSPKRQPSRAPSVTKDAKEKEKESKDKEKEKDKELPERHPRPTGVSVTGPGRVRWSIREPSTVSSTGSTSVPPLPPPPSGPGPTPFYRRSPQVHRKSFLATTAPPHRPLHHAKPSTTTTTITTATTTTTTNTTTSTNVKAPVKHSVHTSVHHHPPIASSAAAAARPDRVKDISRSQVSQQGPNEAQAKTGRDQTAAAAADPSKSSSDSRYASNQAANAIQSMTAEPQVNGDVTGGDSSVASTPPSQTQPPVSATAVSPWIDDEPVVKSPPEPTRVKSPEQMIMRSPEPVNWTVPLDTGKTFTVTQNVREEPLTRPHSEAKSWAPSSVPSAPQSAPPELAAQHKSQHSQHSGYKSPESESVSLGSFSGLNGHKDMDSERDSPLPTNVQTASTPTQGDKESGGTKEETKDPQKPSEPSIKPVAGTNLRCLEDPGFEYDRKKEDSQPTTTAAAPLPASSSSSSSTAPQPGYRILEADSPQGGTTGGGVGGVSSGAGYHVLEAPTVVPGSAQRSAASEVLEKARNRFDKFWGKGNGSEN
ncbi:flocculation protein FLO11 isoform X6 [Ceratina calcarata]|uniref:Nuclear protein MDM1 n=1 Tax=Ceratina calcarata TaxID=156304 RepID=A0AAJ7WF26_9HYME|nr:flocculation protein FLO11 isoform X6 [Ceratina calcarata]XP_026673823.1 flocculation protein FLO11 isoform X6 [Ceratina calcarata]XP_026673824.1 flocculation protein FLO11 isoform X6 [Ceratina calcarata]XP_026673825.1 flocculation protein FLO11 isoform X6 [Ceratina calcarata]XP_026673826.1 flocculation protein FLO11 isoform X6 [Ceratina calcarata]XP_026673827.1 flocculation protein FLO11 isoform X6 [Ceratina calcarata]XP_026673828.1 flocculation protein FLO11 isoform X6 [Ceratina calcarat